MATQKVIGGAAIGRTPPGTPTITERRKAAAAHGEQTFDPGVCCVNGHDSPRWTNSGICVECKRARDNAYNAAHAEEHRARSKRSASARPEAIKEYRRQYYRAHSQSAKARARDWEIAHRDRTRDRRRTWHAKNKERLNAKARRSYAENPQPSRASRRKWKLANRAKVTAGDSLRRAREIGAAVGCRKAYAAYVARMRAARSVRCYWCGAATKMGQRHLDHIVPLARGGADSVANLCVACPPCNMRKNAKMPEDFAGQSEMRLA